MRYGAVLGRYGTGTRSGRLRSHCGTKDRAETQEGTPSAAACTSVSSRRRRRQGSRGGTSVTEVLVVCGPAQGGG